MAVLAIGTALQLSAQSEVTVWMNDGAVQTYYMAENDRMYFEDNEKLIIETGLYAKDIYSILLADIRKITCSETVGTSENSQPELAVYPNPVRDALTLRNLEGTASVRIFTLDGRLVKSFEITENQTVDISELPAGLYLLNVDSRTLKMMKL